MRTCISVFLTEIFEPLIYSKRKTGQRLVLRTKDAYWHGCQLHYCCSELNLFAIQLFIFSPCLEEKALRRNRAANRQTEEALSQVQGEEHHGKMMILETRERQDT